MSIAVVTDSTAYLPEELAGRYSLRTVPLHVSVDGAEPVDESVFGPRELSAALARRHRVTTSGATAEELARTYRAALDTGAEGVVSVHLSRQLSGTWDAARLAAEEVDPHRVRVVDSRSTAMGLGFSALAAGERAQAGADLAAVAATAGRVAERTSTMFSVQTLDYLRRGGRIGTATALLGTALAIKPLLHLRAGRIEALEKVRTTTRAMTRLVEIAVRSASPGPAAIAIHHLDAPERATQLTERIRGQVPDCPECVVSEVGAVIGAHIGPGAVGVVVVPGGWHERS
ncbi:DegV family protein with EDD domain [Halopolyspora algeriensis]|uniref:DegV family protein with EDD domain n=1 Tax=Halopolyspora algeriensis TaxID=1500506 RepID=A0A368VST5_9ACTN|nr:DegV family protein [Halopolyspora algeriensis]RCW45040.1 DegV family protein with EDD domain [Halopolyspora algeriensis]TQM53235.1 DegV family protein with EDD domain [Halopolyspora algeriensis]